MNKQTKDGLSNGVLTVDENTSFAKESEYGYYKFIGFETNPIPAYDRASGRTRIVKGYWKKYPLDQKFNVTYSGVDQNGKAVPAEVAAVMPETASLPGFEAFSLTQPTATEVTTADGVYTFVAYDEVDTTMLKDNTTVTGRWAFTPNAKEEESSPATPAQDEPKKEETKTVKVERQKAIQTGLATSASVYGLVSVLALGAWFLIKKRSA